MGYPNTWAQIKCLLCLGALCDWTETVLRDEKEEGMTITNTTVCKRCAREDIHKLNIEYKVVD